MSNFIDNFKQALGDATLMAEKIGPTVLVTAGVVGLIGAGIAACVNTYNKLPDILDDANEQLSDIHEKIAETTSEEYSEKQYKSDITKVYTKTGLKIVKVYAGPIIIATLSAGMIFASNYELRKKNAELGAAYLTLENMYNRYRNHVKEELGEEADRRFRLGLKTVEYEEEITDEKGKTKSFKKTVEVSDDLGNIEGYSDYARFFDEACFEWDPNPEYNLSFLKTQQTIANQMLISRGHLFLNEVYDMLGIPRTEAGQAVGWLYNKENPIGDNYVDFGIYNIHRERNRAFVNGYEPVILLDFNVDGKISNKI